MASNTYMVDEENLICAICLECWVDRDPRILNCQHTFCFTCIQRLDISNSYITCPVCKENFQVSKKNIGKLKKNLFHNYLIKQDEHHRNEELCQKHRKEGALYCETHKVMNICVKCLNEDHQRCKIVTMEKYLEIEKIMKNLISTINDKKTSVEKDINEKEQKVIREYNAIRDRINKSFDNLKTEIISGLLNNPLNEDKVKDFQEIIQGHVIGKIPETSSIGKSFSPNFKYIYDTFRKLSQPKDQISFHDVAREFNLIFEKLSLSEMEKIVTQQFYNPRNFTPGLIIQLRNDILNCSDIFLMEKYILSETDCRNIAKIIQTKFKIEALYLKRNFQGLSDILDGFENSYNSLADVAIINCNLNEIQLKNLGNILINCGGIESINLSLNSNMREGLRDVCIGLMKSFNVLRHLDFSYCHLTEGQCGPIEKLVKQCIRLERVNLGQNRLMGNGLLNILKALECSSNSLQDINLANCDLNYKHCEILGDLLNQCSTLQKVNLQDNKNMGRGIVDICKGLRRSSKSLKILNFRNTDLNFYQGDEIIRLSEECSNIQNINISRNPFMMYEFPNLFDTYRESFRKTITEIDLSDFKMTNTLKSNIEYSLSQCVKLENFRIDCLMLSNYSFNFYEALRNSVGSLKVLIIKSLVRNSEIYKNVEQLVINCKKLEEVNLDFILLDFSSSFKFPSLMRSKNALKKINFGCPLSKEASESLAILLESCTNIESIGMGIEVFEDPSSRNLINALKKLSTRLKEFSLHELRQQSRTAEYLEVFKSCTKLEKVSTYWNKGLKSALLSSADSLRELYFRGKLGEDCCKDIAEIIEKCPNIEILCLKNIGKCGNSMLNIAKGLSKSSKSLRGVSIVFQNFIEAKSSKLLDSWKSCPKSYIRSLSFNVLVGSDAEFDYDTWCSTPFSITNINLSNSNINQAQCKVLSEYLTQLSQIEYINLSNNSKLENGIVFICQGLMSSAQNLRIINFCNTKMSDSHCDEFGKLLSKCCLLEYINVQENNISNGFTHIFKGLLNTSNYLKFLYVGNCVNINMNVKKNLVDLLNQCSYLQEICLAKFQFNDNEIEDICTGLNKSISSLTYLDLRQCMLSEKQEILLCETLKECTTLKEILFRNEDTTKSEIPEIISKYLNKLKYSLRSVNGIVCLENHERTEITINFPHYFQMTY